MWKNSSLLFILLLIITFPLCQEEDCNTSSPNPNSRNDCFAISVSNGYCCFKSTSEKCQFVKRGSLASNKDLDCGITEENYGKYEFGQYHPDQKELDGLDFETCGKTNPSKKKDCTDYSEISNSCCLFTKGSDKACFHIGRKYISNSNKNTFKIGDNNEEEVTVECKSFNIILNLYSILLIIYYKYIYLKLSHNYF